MLNKNKDGERFLSASGRDVEMEERHLSWNPVTREVTAGAEINRSTFGAQELENKIVDFVRANPGCMARDITKGVTGQSDAIASARSKCESQGRLKVTKVGSASLFHVNEASVFKAELA
jgi:hypothetical protein